jgi:hypothetical protein
MMACASVSGNVARDKSLDLHGLKVGVVAVTGYQSEVVAGKISECLMQSGARVIERAGIESIFREQRFQLSGAVDQEKAVEIGKIIGVDAVFIGNMSDPVISNVANFADNTWSTASVSFSGRLIDVKTAETLASGTVISKRGDENRAVINSVEGFFERIPTRRH